MVHSLGNLLPSSYEEKIADFRKQLDQRVKQFERAVQFDLLTTTNAIREEFDDTRRRICTDVSAMACGRL